MRLEHDQKRTLLVTGILTLTFVFGLWMPQHLEQRQLEQRIENAQRQLGFDRKGSVGLTELTDEVAELTAALHNTKKHIPADSELAPLLRKVGAELSNHARGDDEITTDPVLDGAQYSLTPIHVEFRGDFTGAFAFLKSVESMRRLVRVHRLELVTRGRGDSRRLDVSVSLAAFHTVETPPQEGR